jgi:hypothetical protein
MGSLHPAGFAKVLAEAGWPGFDQPALPGAAKGGEIRMDIAEEGFVRFDKDDGEP